MASRKLRLRRLLEPDQSASTFRSFAESSSSRFAKAFSRGLDNYSDFKVYKNFFDGVPGLTDFSNYEQPGLKKNNVTWPSTGHVPTDEIACRCSSKGNDKMLICSIDWRDRTTLLLLDNDFSSVVIYPCSC
jgi:hypothetical protein